MKDRQLTSIARVRERQNLYSFGLLQQFPYRMSRLDLPSPGSPVVDYFTMNDDIWVIYTDAVLYKLKGKLIL